MKINFLFTKIKVKTPEQIEKELEKGQERLEANKLKKQKKEEEKQKLKEEKEDLKTVKVRATQLNKEVRKAQKTSDKHQAKAQSANNDILKKENPTKSEKEKLKQFNDQANEYVKHYQNLYKKSRKRRL